MSKRQFGLIIIFELARILLVSDAKIHNSNIRVGQKFIKEGFVPFLFEHYPNCSAQMSYNTLRVRGGTIFTRDEVINEPQLRYMGKLDYFHTVVMARPVIPEDGDPSKYQEFDHWIVGNIPGSKVYKGEVILPYNIPPKDNDELYPYVFGIFQQTGKLSFVNELYNDTLKTVPGCVRLRQFISKYDLIGPTSANYFILC